MLRGLAHFCSLTLVAMLLAMTGAIVIPAHGGQHTAVSASTMAGAPAGDMAHRSGPGTEHEHSGLICCQTDLFCAAFDPSLRDGGVAFRPADHSTVTWSERAPRRAASVTPDVSTPPPKAHA